MSNIRRCRFRSFLGFRFRLKIHEWFECFKIIGWPRIHDNVYRPGIARDLKVVCPRNAQYAVDIVSSAISMDFNQNRFVDVLKL